MKIKTIFCLLLMVPTLLVARGYDGYGCCNPCMDWLCGVSFNVDWLYWNIRRSNLDYAIPYVDDTADNSIGDVHRVEPDFKSGVRVGLHKECGCFDYAIWYTYFDQNYIDTIDSPAGNQAGTRLYDKVAAVDIGDVTRALGKWKIDYDHVDVNAGYRFETLGCACLHLFGGFTWAGIDQEYDTDYLEGSSTFDRIHQTLDMNAYGVNFGADVSMSLWSCLDCIGALWYNMLVGDFDYHWQYQNSDSFVGDLKDDTCELIGLLNLAFGLKYTHPRCSWGMKTAQVSVGYEFHQWLNMPEFLWVIGSDEPTLNQHRTNLSFDGLFVRLHVGY